MKTKTKIIRDIEGIIDMNDSIGNTPNELIFIGSNGCRYLIKENDKIRILKDRIGKCLIITGTVDNSHDQLELNVLSFVDNYDYVEDNMDSADYEVELRNNKDPFFDYESIYT